MTEKHYISGLRNNKNGLGITSSLMDVYEIPRLHLNENETDMDRMIRMAEDYITFNRTGQYSVGLLATIIYENMYKCALDQPASIVCNKLDRIRGNKDELRKVRTDIEAAIQDDLCCDKTCSLAPNRKFSFNTLRKMLKSKYSFKLDDIDYDVYRRQTVESGDIVCIIHDRDYHKYYFNDNAYEKAIRKCRMLSAKGDIEYRPVITFPQFEFWLLLHCASVVPEKLNIKRLSEYIRNGRDTNECKKYIKELMESNLKILYENDPNGKKIPDDVFDTYLLPGIVSAIAKSKSKVLCTDVDRLKKEPGTTMGLLIDEMIRK